MKTLGLVLLLSLLAPLATLPTAQAAPPPTDPLQVRIANGILAGTRTASGVRVYKGIPYAQPPIGPLRWREPQPPRNCPAPPESGFTA